MQNNLLFAESLADEHRRDWLRRAEKQQRANDLLSNESQRPPRRSFLAKYRAEMTFRK